MKLARLFENCDVKYDEASGNIEISAVVTSSESAVPGCVFAAIKGRRRDGYDKIGEAVKKGAVCVLSDRVYDDGKTVNILTDDVRRAVALAFSNFYGNPDRGMTVAAVTGTNGKTTTALTLEHILRRAGRRVGVIGTLGVTVDGKSILGDGEAQEYSMTTPDPELLYKSLYQMKKAGCSDVVLEASSHALELRKTDGLHVDVGAFTNLTPEHLDFHSDMESYFLAKRRLCVMADRFAANVDDPYGRRLAGEFSNVKSFSCVPESAADSSVSVTAAAYRNLGFDGISYVYYSREAIFDIRSPMWGRNALYNTVCAAASALELGVPQDTVRAALGDFHGVRGRLETAACGRGKTRVIVDYAHTPDALEKSIRTVRGLMGKRSRLILVFGCGGDRDTKKRAVMGQIADRLCDFTFVTSDNSRSEDPLKIISMIEEGFSDPGKYTVVVDRESALRQAVFYAGSRDVVLVCGKGHEEYITDSRGKREFHERDILRRAFSEKYGL